VEEFETHSASETLALGRRLAARFGAGDCVALVGGLGAGKTVLVRGLAEGMGLRDSRLVASPTFVLAREYPGRVPIHHLDLYRMTAPDAELAQLGLEEMLADGVVVVEWADRAPNALPLPHWRVTIRITGETRRQLCLGRVD